MIKDIHYYKKKFDLVFENLHFDSEDEIFSKFKNTVDVYYKQGNLKYLKALSAELDSFWLTDLPNEIDEYNIKKILYEQLGEDISDTVIKFNNRVKRIVDSGVIKSRHDYGLLKEFVDKNWSKESDDEIVNEINKMLAKEEIKGTIKKIIQLLKQYPHIDYDSDFYSLTVYPNDKKGFQVSISVDFREIIIFYHSGHDHFSLSEEEEAIQFFIFLLSRACRLSIKYKNNKAISWTIESYDNDNWVNEVKTGIFNFKFLQPTRIEYLQNDLIQNIDSLLK